MTYLCPSNQRRHNDLGAMFRRHLLPSSHQWWRNNGARTPACQNLRKENTISNSMKVLSH